MCGQDPQDVKAVYDAVCRSHDGIADFRAKLLTLLPIASGVGIFFLLGDEPPAQDVVPHLLPIGLFGMLVTLGLFFYELRGIQKCNGLIACAKRLEQVLLPRLWPFGAFNSHQDAVLGHAVGATGAALVIYSTVLGGWVYVAGVGAANSIALNGRVMAVAAAAAIGFALWGWEVTRLQDDHLKLRLEALKSDTRNEIPPVQSPSPAWMTTTKDM